MIYFFLHQSVTKWPVSHRLSLLSDGENLRFFFQEKYSIRLVEENRFWWNFFPANVSRSSLEWRILPYLREFFSRLSETVHLVISSKNRKRWHRGTNSSVNQSSAIPPKYFLSSIIVSCSDWLSQHTATTVAVAIWILLNGQTFVGKDIIVF